MEINESLLCSKRKAEERIWVAGNRRSDSGHLQRLEDEGDSICDI